VSGSGKYDCQRCGACCVNLPENRAEGFHSWVEVEAGDRILEQPDRMRKLVVHDADGVPHLRLAPDGRCLSLLGGLGRRVRCAIYHDRPSPCRRVQAGDALCRMYRIAHGIDR
jgi:Fe-S-cluster containining protein